jgi:hypothetical protein
MHTAAILGYFLAFGLMGLWHGIEPHYIIYGFYQATLLSGFHIFSSWNKARHYWPDGLLSRALAVLITFHFVCFGLLIFSGRIGAPPPPHYVAGIQDIECNAISGWVYDNYKPTAPVPVQLWDGDHLLTTVSANQFRQELLDAGYGNGRHAFRLPTPSQLKDGQSHLVRLRVADVKNDLLSTNKVIVCP